MIQVILSLLVLYYLIMGLLSAFGMKLPDGVWGWPFRAILSIAKVVIKVLTEIITGIVSLITSHPKK